MPQEAVPLPKEDEIFAVVKSSCHGCRESAGLVLDEEEITTFLTSLNDQESLWSKLSSDHGTKLPLKFDTFLQEVNLIAILSLLNFGSGYRVALKRLTGRGAFDTIRALVLSFHISQTDLSATGLSGMTAHDIASLTQIPVSEETAHPTIQGLQIGKSTQLARLVEEIAGVLRTTGDVLVKGGYQNLGALVIECAKRAKVDRKGVSASRFIYHIIEAIPGFQDMCIIHNQPVYILKKVQLLASDLSLRFSSARPELFDFYDIGESPIFSDNVIPTILNHLKIIRLSVPSDANSRQKQIIEELQEDLRTGRPTTRKRSYIFRAAAVDACEVIVQRGKEISDGNPFVRSMTARHLDAYLWQAAKQGEKRNVTRFCDASTVYF